MRRLDKYDIARSRRLELLGIIAQAADEIAAIDAALPILQSISLEADLLRAEELFVKSAF